MKARIPFVKNAIKRISLFLFFSVSCSAQVTSLDLPDIGDSTGTILSPEFERRLGQAFLNQIRRQVDIISDPEVEAYIRSIGYRLVSHSDNNTQSFTFFVINDPMINAFAAPGGIIGINSGTIINTESESELAGVVAHEIAHVTQKHMARSVEMQQQMSIPLMAAMLGAILIATQNPEAGQAAIAAVQGGALQAQINFTRNNEMEADRVGMQLLARSGLNPRGMPSFFEKLHRNSRYAGNAPEFLRTHPLANNRIADTRSRAENYPADHSYEESRLYEYVRAKLIVMNHKNAADAVEHFEDQLRSDKIKDNLSVLRYGAAQAHMEAGNFARARQYLDALLEREPENTSFLLARADLEARQGNYNRAIELYEKMERLYPDYRPLVFSYAETLLNARKPERARELLKSYGKFNDPDLRYYNYLARAEAEAGNPVESAIANAEYYYLTGETRVAMEQLRYILRQPPKPDYYQEERIRARLAFLEQELQISKDMNLVK